MAAEFDVPVAGAAVTGHWTGLSTATCSGTTAADGTVVCQSAAIRNPVGTYTFVLDSVKKSGVFLDRTNSVLTNSISAP